MHASQQDPKSQKHIDALRKEIAEHDKLYYQQACPQISDFQYDKLKKELEELETRSTEAHTRESPAQKSR